MRYEHFNNITCKLHSKHSKMGSPPLFAILENKFMTDGDYNTKHQQRGSRKTTT